MAKVLRGRRALRVGLRASRAEGVEVGRRRRRKAEGVKVGKRRGRRVEGVEDEGPAMNF